MKLTGLAKEAFKNWFDENYNYYWTYYHAKPVILNALIIEFFDSVGTWNKVFLECYDNGLGNYKEATNAAIEKANYLFNSK